ncbi:branched-chain amino acid transport system carrier protein [Fusibacter sp. 3D3]|nr:branched-chain amino acid transport system carrier protein [Fusibacter sp. 3D3]
MKTVENEMLLIWTLTRLSHEKNVEYFRKSECENAEGINGNNYKKELKK